MTIAASEQILLNCARQEMSSDLIETTQALLKTQIDWEDLARTAWRHGVASLLHRHLSSQAFEGFVPNECKDRLRQYYVRAAFRSQTHFAATTELAAAFERSKCPLLLLKGAALSLTTYRDQALRPFADIDLLIREADFVQAKSALLACGYVLAPELTSEKLSRRFHINLPFVKRDERPVHVELHWNLVDRFTNYQLPPEQVWERARRIAVGQTNAFVLEVHDEIIYLATHLDKHGYLNQVLARSDDAAHRVIDELSANRLIWFTDLHELIMANAIDWRLIETRCGTGELRHVADSTLELLRRLLGTDLTGSELLRRRPRFSKRLLDRAVRSAVKNEKRREFFRTHVLATRKGFELRLIRLADLWNFVFPHEGRSLAHSLNAINQSLSLFLALLALRLRQR